MDNMDLFSDYGQEKCEDMVNRLFKSYSPDVEDLRELFRGAKSDDLYYKFIITLYRISEGEAVDPGVWKFLHVQNHHTRDQIYACVGAGYTKSFLEFTKIDSDAHGVLLSLRFGYYKTRGFYSYKDYKVYSECANNEYDSDEFGINGYDPSDYDFADDANYIWSFKDCCASYFRTYIPDSKDIEEIMDGRITDTLRYHFAVTLCRIANWLPVNGAVWKVLNKNYDKLKDRMAELGAPSYVATILEYSGVDFGSATAGDVIRYCASKIYNWGSEEFYKQSDICSKNTNVPNDNTLDGKVSDEDEYSDFSIFDEDEDSEDDCVDFNTLGDENIETDSTNDGVVKHYYDRDTFDTATVSMITNSPEYRYLIAEKPGIDKKLAWEVAKLCKEMKEEHYREPNDSAVIDKFKAPTCMDVNIMDPIIQDYLVGYTIAPSACVDIAVMIYSIAKHGCNDSALVELLCRNRESIRTIGKDTGAHKYIELYLEYCNENNGQPSTDTARKINNAFLREVNK